MKLRVMALNKLYRIVSTIHKQEMQLQVNE